MANNLIRLSNDEEIVRDHGEELVELHSAGTVTTAVTVFKNTMMTEIAQSGAEAFMTTEHFKHQGLQKLGELGAGEESLKTYYKMLNSISNHIAANTLGSAEQIHSLALKLNGRR